MALLPTAIVIGILFHWSGPARTAVYATARMLVQLLLVGYVLVYIFAAESPAIVVGVLVLMVTAASWIAVRPLRNKQPRLFLHALTAIAVGGVLTLALTSQAVINVEPWFNPRYVLPLAGMIFAGAMNTVSLAAERFQAERDKGRSCLAAKRTAFQTALIPSVNSLFAVGLVSLPGMMTGQILAGGSPVVAAKYQIVVMTMLFGTSGISAALYLTMAARHAPADNGDGQAMTVD